MKNRYFAIKHEKCDCVFTINAEYFLEYCKSPPPEAPPIGCPSCRQEAMKLETLKAFIDAYQKVIDELKKPKNDDKGNVFTIREISGDIYTKDFSL